MNSDQFIVKDSGQRQEFASGMVRDVQDDKPMVRLIRSGPMFMRWAIHLTKGAVKYGRDNWTLANSEEELERFKDSAARHFEQWLNGERDEDHAAAVFFNINAAEYVLDRLMFDLENGIYDSGDEFLESLEEPEYSVKVPDFPQPSLSYRPPGLRQ
jgi:hypothetical protein